MNDINYSNVLYMLPSLLSSTNCEQYDESEVGLTQDHECLPHSIIRGVII